MSSLRDNTGEYCSGHLVPKVHGVCPACPKREKKTIVPTQPTKVCTCNKRKNSLLSYHCSLHPYGRCDTCDEVLEMCAFASGVKRPHRKSSRETPRRKFRLCQKCAVGIVLLHDCTHCERMFDVSQMKMTTGTRLGAFGYECRNCRNRLLVVGSSAGVLRTLSSTASVSSSQKPQIGRVLRSGKMQKTVTVGVDRMVVVPIYGKRIKRTTKILVHDEQEMSEEGDIVELIKCRPRSKSKHHELLSVVKKDPARDFLRSHPNWRTSHPSEKTDDSL